MRMRTMWMGLALWSAAGMASAGEGRIEINQASVEAAGGFPYEITQPGSYVLTSNLVVSGGVGALVIGADDVSIDLGGFSVIGDFTCEPGACTLGSTGGIAGKVAFPTVFGNRSRVHNGQVRGFSNSCILLGTRSRAENVTVSECGGTGVVVLDGLIVDTKVDDVGRSGVTFESGDGVARSVQVGRYGLGLAGEFALRCDATACPIKEEAWVVEIDQACASGAGCFEGDAAGFPVEITGVAGSSYRLSSDLVVPDANTTAVEISADDIALDLGGHTIRGVTTCSGLPASCSSSGSGHGVSVSGDSAEISNGAIEGAGADGISASGFGTRAQDLRIRWSGARGMTLERAASVARCTILENGATGIDLFGFRESLHLTDSVIEGNGGAGVQAATGLIASNQIRDNGGAGVSVFGGGAVLLRDNLIESNDLAGLSVGSGSDQSVAYGDNVISENATPVEILPTSSPVVFNAGGNFCKGPGTIAASCP